MDTLRLNPGDPRLAEAMTRVRSVERTSTSEATPVPPNAATLPLSATQASFADRVQLALVRFFATFFGPVAAEKIEAEVRERGRPNDLVSALALGHALMMQIPSDSQRTEARSGLDALLRSIKVSSVVPPPISNGKSSR